MRQLEHGIVQLASLFARYPWPTFAVLMTAVLSLMWWVGDRPRRVSDDFDFFSALGDGDGGD